MTVARLTILLTSLLSVAVLAQAPAQPDWKALEDETMQHYQALLRIDTRNPPGNEHAPPSTSSGVRQGRHPRAIVAPDPKRSNVVARLKGNGKKKPLLIMGHSDVVTVDEAKWKFPPFSATRDGGYVYGRGTVDDKDNLTAGADDDAAAEAAERAARSRRDLPVRSRRGRQLRHRHRLHGERALSARSTPSTASPKAAASTRIGGAGEVRDGADAGEDPARHRAGGARHLRPRVGAAQVERHRPPRRRGRQGRRLAAGDPLQRDDRHLLPQAGGDLAARTSRSTTATCCRPIPKVRRAADDWLLENEPRHSSMLRTSVSPNIFTGGYRSNVIPSEAKATLDVRALPDEDPGEVPRAGEAGGQRSGRRGAVHRRVDRARRAPTRSSTPKSFKALEAAGDAHLQRADAADDEHRRHRHGAAARARACSASASVRRSTSRTRRKGFGAHSDQERLLESELHRFVRFNWDVVVQPRGGAVSSRRPRRAVDAAVAAAN